MAHSSNLGVGGTENNENNMHKGSQIFVGDYKVFFEKKGTVKFLKTVVHI